MQKKIVNRLHLVLHACVEIFDVTVFFAFTGFIEAFIMGDGKDESTLLTNRSSEKDEKTDKSMETFEFTSLLRC